MRKSGFDETLVEDLKLIGYGVRTSFGVSIAIWDSSKTLTSVTDDTYVLKAYYLGFPGRRPNETRRAASSSSSLDGCVRLPGSVFLPPEMMHVGDKAIPTRGKHRGVHAGAAPDKFLQSQ